MSWLPSPEYADWWYDLSWKGIISFGAFAAFATAATVVFTVIQFWSDGVRDRRAEERTIALEARASEANTEAARANEAAAKARERAAELAKETVELRQKMAWRRITPLQHRTIVDALAGFKFSVWVSYVGDDPESTVFREDIDQTLRAAGLETKFFSGWKVSVGLQITDDPEGPERDALIKAFALAGIPLASTKAQMAKGQLQIIVGTKPPPF